MNNIIINLFAPKLEAAPVPSTITLPSDAVLDDSLIKALFETDIEPQRGLVSCAKIRIMIARDPRVLSHPPKTLTFQMIPRGQLPEWFKLDSLKKRDANKVMGGDASTKINEILKARGLGLPSDSETDDSEEEEEVDMSDERGSKKAVMDLKSADSPSSVVSVLQNMVSLVEDPTNIQTMVDIDVSRILKSVMSKHKDNTEIASLAAGLMSNMCMLNPNSKQVIMQEGICEELVSICEHQSDRSLEVMSRKWRPNLSNFWVFAADGGAGDATSIQKWVCVAIMALASDPESQRRVMGRVPGLFKV
jgi:hypothetical protein